jgi:hypothetical protein
VEEDRLPLSCPSYPTHAIGAEARTMEATTGKDRSWEVRTGVRLGEGNNGVEEGSDVSQRTAAVACRCCGRSAITS